MRFTISEQSVANNFRRHSEVPVGGRVAKRFHVVRAELRQCDQLLVEQHISLPVAHGKGQPVAVGELPPQLPNSASRSESAVCARMETRPSTPASMRATDLPNLQSKPKLPVRADMPSSQVTKTSPSRCSAMVQPRGGCPRCRPGNR